MTDAAPKVRTGQAPAPLGRDEFHMQFMRSFQDPAFGPVRSALAQVEEIAWTSYRDGRKAPVTQKAGSGFADPDYELSVEWRATRDRLLAAEKRQKDVATRSRVLLVVGAARNDGSCPGEISKTFRMAQWAQQALAESDIENDLLDLSLLTSGYDLHIHPCKGCVSTAMPLCHWPCSCYPNHGQRQTGDWMAEIYEKWVAAHGVIILTPVYWYQAPSVLKLMMDRLVCADGGNPDPTSTHGKHAQEAKALELAGWDYPKHLAGRAYGLVVHGDVAGAEGVRRDLADWLDWMGLIDAGKESALDRYVGYYTSYAASHEVLDADEKLQQEVRDVARSVAAAVGQLRTGWLTKPDAVVHPARPK
ncbi:flavodoxin family protein [Duganella violaceipulchra]|uniref:Flavodoxin family protein n=1 Tax=Duganella violaceipulchra TaxID=2849652 RepID=A0AA41H4Q0_9BURK|nr:flavodoxin family protein [Duganella violaceicalia]MBV6319739.1 flavodoxin family protein [Duganella violaceicalia]MCP2006448.1 multimeric flavodoxin WrbA [Duganella violaceicalia]